MIVSYPDQLLTVTMVFVHPGPKTTKDDISCVAQRRA